ncbi:hypothetical protein BDP27DRAFT_1368358 [Rhodocollybia butyracea]|uniref:Uncharacterized protein n=1 Tax=Rhodocollybia butyracea TaxID=206335 RepID=A0A9P5PJ45_9AGAR|nr:hypothetical protein BDP27DRAFT_1368358 [Rhodocollybia butyracea]
MKEPLHASNTVRREFEDRGKSFGVIWNKEMKTSHKVVTLTSLYSFLAFRLDKDVWVIQVKAEECWLRVYLDSPQPNGFPTVAPGCWFPFIKRIKATELSFKPEAAQDYVAAGLPHSRICMIQSARHTILGRISWVDAQSFRNVNDARGKARRKIRYSTWKDLWGIYAVLDKLESVTVWY